MGNVTIEDVAKDAGVSNATVSRILNNKNNVNKQLVKKVKKSIEKLNYKPNKAAQHMRGKKTNNIGCVVPNIEIPFFSRIINGAICELRKQDGLVTISNSEGKREIEEDIMKQFARSILDGLIFCPVANQEPISQMSLINELSTVIIARRNVFEGIPHIYSDDIKGGYLATKYLLRTGHKNIAFVAGFWEAPCNAENIYEIAQSEKSGIYTTLDRFRGYVKALEEFNKSINKKLIEVSGYSYNEGYKAAKSLYENLVDIDAIIAANDIVAAGILSFCKNHGIKVPEDISILGYDDQVIPSITQPKLSSIQQDSFKMGQEAVKSLNKLIAGEKVKNKVIDVKLSIKESTVTR